MKTGSTQGWTVFTNHTAIKHSRAAYTLVHAGRLSALVKGSYARHILYLSLVFVCFVGLWATRHVSSNGSVYLFYVYVSIVIVCVCIHLYSCDCVCLFCAGLDKKVETRRRKL